MIIYISSTRGDMKNTSYPVMKEINVPADLVEAAAFDHVGCKFQDGKNNRGTFIKAYRSNKTFESADVIIMDCDNTSQDPTTDLPKGQWKKPTDVAAAFPGVEFYVVYSRNHNKSKNGKPPRPKFHVYFPLSTNLKDIMTLERLKREVVAHFPSFDPNAIKITQCMFGVENPKVEYFKGSTTIDRFMEEERHLPEVIPEGERNDTLSKYAGKLITRLGDTQEAWEEFQKAAERCQSPLEKDELKTIWRSAQGFFHSKVEAGWENPATFEFGKEKRGFTLDSMKRLLSRMGIILQMNDITGKVEITGLPAKIPKGDAANALPGQIRSYMNQKGINCSRSDMDDFLTNILAENHYNPVKLLLESTTWDGEDRIEELLTIMGVINEFEKSLVTKWLHQCVAMALNDEDNPYGADGVLVLQGDQGIGKTLLCSKLAIHHDWFAEGVSIDMSNKDTIIQSTGVWIGELGELDSTLKREQSALKAFLTSRVDTYRVPYGRAAVTHPRRTSFCATVNPERFLNDDTGSRRFWVVRPKIDLEAVLNLDTVWLQQLWAQVYTTLYKDNPQGFRLTKDEQKKLASSNEEFSKPLTGEIEILDRLNFEMPVKRWKWVTASQVVEILHGKYVSAVQVGRVLMKLSREDDRIQIKEVHHTKHYFLPPSRERGLYPTDDEDDFLK